MKKQCRENINIRTTKKEYVNVFELKQSIKINKLVCNDKQHLISDNCCHNTINIILINMMWGVLLQKWKE